MQKTNKSTLAGFLAFTFLCVGEVCWAEENLEGIIQLETEVTEEGAISQQVVSQLSEETRVLLEEYRMVRQQTDNLKKYNAELSGLIEAQEGEGVSIESQIDRAAVTERDIVPLMSELAATLGHFVALDLPFLSDERNKRVNGVRDVLKRSDISTSEKFRRIMEAYQIEGEYGRTMEAYRMDIDLGAGQRTVDVLRVGRVTLLYRTLDGTSAGFWDQLQKKWQPLPDGYEELLRKGFMIARKRAAPDMMKVPVAVTSFQ